MMNNKIFSKNEIWNMDTNAFSKLFFNKNVSVYLENGQIINGIVIEVGLSVNLNINPSERLPVSIKVANNNIFLTSIKQIELK